MNQLYRKIKAWVGVSVLIITCCATPAHALLRSDVPSLLAISSNVKLWLDSATNNSVTNISINETTGKVQVWYDLSGNGNHASQNTTESQPVWSTTNNSYFKNNKPTLSFEGASQLNLPDNILIDGSPSYSVFTVVRNDRSVGTGLTAISLYFSAGGTSGGDYLGLGFTESGTGVIVDWKSNDLALTNNVLATQNFGLITHTYAPISDFSNDSAYNGDNSSRKIYVNGIEKILAATHGNASRSFNSVDYKIGKPKTVGANDPLIGNIAEIIVVSNVLSTANRLAIEKYLIEKWDLGVSEIADSDGDTLYDPNDPFPADPGRVTSDIWISNTASFSESLPVGSTIATLNISGYIPAYFNGYIAYSTGNINVLANRTTINIQKSFGASSGVYELQATANVPVTKNTTVTVTIALVSANGSLIPSVDTEFVSVTVPNTPPVDSDNDGVIDEYDLFPEDNTQGGLIQIISPVNRQLFPNNTTIDVVISTNIASGFVGSLAISTRDILNPLERTTINIGTRVTQSFVVEEHAGYTLKVAAVDSLGNINTSVVTKQVQFLTERDPIVSGDYVVTGSGTLIQESSILSNGELFIGYLDTLNYKIPSSVTVSSDYILIGDRRYVPQNLEISGNIKATSLYVAQRAPVYITQNSGLVEAVLVLNSNASYTLSGGKVSTDFMLLNDQSVLNLNGGVFSFGFINAQYITSNITFNGSEWLLQTPAVSNAGVVVNPSSSVTFLVTTGNPSAFPKISVNSLTLNASLTVSVAPGVILVTGSTYTLFESINTTSISITRLSLPSLNPGLFWVTTNLVTQGTISISGDSDSDGVIDREDAFPADNTRSTADVWLEPASFPDSDVVTGATYITPYINAKVASSFVGSLAFSTGNFLVTENRVTINTIVSTDPTSWFGLYNIPVTENTIVTVTIGIIDSIGQVVTSVDPIVWVKSIPVDPYADRDRDGVINRDDSYPDDRTRGGIIRIMVPSEDEVFIPSSSETVSINLIISTNIASGFLGKIAISTGNILVSENRQIYNITRNITKSISLQSYAGYKVIVAAVNTQNMVDTDILEDRIYIRTEFDKPTQNILIDGLVTQSVDLATTRDILIGESEEGSRYVIQEGVSISAYIVDIGPRKLIDNHTMSMEGGTLNAVIFLVGQRGLSFVTQSAGFADIYALDIGEEGVYSLTGGTLKAHDIDMENSLPDSTIGSLQLKRGTLETTKIILPTENTLVVESVSVNVTGSMYVHGGIDFTASSNLRIGLLSPSFSAKQNIRASSLTLNGSLTITTANLMIYKTVTIDEVAVATEDLEAISRSVPILEEGSFFQLFNVSNNLVINPRSIHLPELPYPLEWVTSNLLTSGNISIQSYDQDRDGTSDLEDAFPTDNTRATADIWIQPESFPDRELSPGITEVVLYLNAKVSKGFIGNVVISTRDFSVTENRVTIDHYVDDPTSNPTFWFVYHGVPLNGRAVTVTIGLADQTGALLPGVEPIVHAKSIPDPYIEWLYPVEGQAISSNVEEVTINIKTWISPTYNGELIITTGDISNVESWHRYPLAGYSYEVSGKIPLDLYHVYTLTAGIASQNTLDTTIATKSIRIGTKLGYETILSTILWEGEKVVTASIFEPEKLIQIGNIYETKVTIDPLVEIVVEGIIASPRNGLQVTVDSKGLITVFGQMMLGNAGWVTWNQTDGGILAEAISIGRGKLILTSGNITSTYLDLLTEGSEFIGRGGQLQLSQAGGANPLNTGGSTLKVYNRFASLTGLEIPSEGQIELECATSNIEDPMVAAYGITLNGKLKFTTNLMLDHEVTFNLFYVNPSSNSIISPNSIELPDLPYSYVTWNTSLLRQGKLLLKYADSDTDGVIDIYDSEPLNASITTANLTITNRSDFTVALPRTISAVTLDVSANIPLTPRTYVLWSKGLLNSVSQNMENRVILSRSLGEGPVTASIIIPVNEGNIYQLNLALIDETGKILTGSAMTSIASVKILGERPADSTTLVTANSVISTENLGLWIDSASIRGVATGDPLSVLKDNSSSGNNIINIHSDRPTTLRASTSLVNQRTIYADGFVGIPLPTRTLNSKGNFEIYMVISQEEFRRNSTLFAINNTELKIGTREGRLTVQSEGSLIPLSYIYENRPYLIHIRQKADAGVLKLNVRISGGNEFRRTITFLESEIRSVFLFGQPDDMNGFKGELAELRVYNRQLTSRERLILEDELSKKWHLHLNRAREL